MKRSSRQFENETDLQLMRTLLVEARQAAGHRAGYWHVGDLIWRYFLLSFRADPCKSIRLWQDANGKLIGYAVFGDDFSIDWQILPDACWNGIEEQVMAWAKERWNEAMNDPSIPSEWKSDLFSGAWQNDSRRIAFLEQHGFTRGTSASVHFMRSLNEPISSVQLPTGFIVRGVAGEHEVANRASAHREAFEPSRVTDDGYTRLMRLPGYDREMDVVAVSPDGVITAYAMAWADTVNKIGEFEPVGARPAFQHKGLTRAALLEGMRRMKKRGADTAIVATGEKNDPALPLYESAGFQRVDRELEYVRKT